MVKILNSLQELMTEVENLAKLVSEVLDITINSLETLGKRISYLEDLNYDIE